MMPVRKLKLRKTIEKSASLPDEKIFLAGIMAIDLNLTAMKLLLYVRKMQIQCNEEWIPAVTLATICSEINKKKTEVRKQIVLLQKSGLLKAEKVEMSKTNRFSISYELLKPVYPSSTQRKLSIKPKPVKSKKKAISKLGK